MSNELDMDRSPAGSGFSTIDASFPVEAPAVRMLPEDAPGLGVAIAGDVLMVATARVPSPAEFRTLEQMSGMPVTVAVAGPTDYAALQDKANATVPQNTPRAVGPALADAAEAGASDVVLRVGDVPRMRVDGRMIEIGRYPVLSEVDVQSAGRWLLGDLAAVGAVGAPATQGVALYGDSRWRVSLYRTQGNAALAARRMPERIPRLEDLGVPSAVVDLARATHGLVLVTGASGMGKTTTAAALVDRINSTRQAHIVTVEEPVEYRHRPLSAAVTQREVGLDVDTFAQGVQQAQRQSADVIVVGELSDADSARAALTAAQSGQLVIATMAAPTAQDAAHRLVTLFTATEQHQVRAQMSAALRAVIAQRLVPSTEPGRRELVCEVLLATDAIRTLLREGRTHELTATLENHVRAGMTSMDRSLAYYVAAGRVSETDALALCVNPDRFTDHLRRAPGTTAGGPEPST